MSFALPNYSAQLSARGVPSPSRASGSDLYDGRGAQALAQGVQDVTAVAQDWQARRDAISYEKSMASLRLSAARRQQDLSTQEYPENTDLAESWAGEFDALSKTVTIPRSLRGRFEADTATMRSSMGQAGLAESARRAAIAAKTTWQEIVTQNANAASINPGFSDQALSALESAAAALPVDPATRASLLADGRQSVRASVAIKTARDAPGAFLAQAQAGKWNDLENLQSVVSAAQSEQKRAAAEAKAALALEVRPAVEDALAEIEATGTSALLPSRDKIASVYGAERADRILQQADYSAKLHAATESLATLPPDQIVQKLSEFAPSGEGFKAEYAGQRAMAAAADRLLKLRADDPAAYAATYFPEVKAAYASAKSSNDPKAFQTAIALSLEAQETIGVPSHARRVLGKAQAQEYVSSLSVMKPQEQTDFVTSLRGTFGPHWLAALNALDAAGLDPALSVLGTLDPTSQAVARADLASALAVPKKDLESAVDSEKKKTVESAVTGALLRYAGTRILQNGGPSEIVKTTDAVNRLALYYALRGASATVAAQRAADGVVNDKWSYNGTYRVPKSYDAGAIDEALSARLAGVAEDQDILPNVSGSLYPGVGEDFVAAQYRQRLAEGGVWQTNEAEDGVILFDPLGYHVRTPKGRYEIKFEDLKDFTPRHMWGSGLGGFR